MNIGAIGGYGGGGMHSITEMRQRMFNKMDQDGDGVISATECQTAAADMSEKTGLSITADEMMSIFDLDQDGVITQAEQTEASPEWEKHMASLMEEAGMKPMGPPPPPPDASNDTSELLDQIFSAMDTDGDGVISKAEYEAAMEQLTGTQDGSGASDTAAADTTSTDSTDSATATASSTDSTTDTSSENTLAALIQQLLENMMTMEKYQHHYPYPGSQDSAGTDAYA